MFKILKFIFAGFVSTALISSYVYADASQITSGLSSQLQIINSFVSGDLKTYILSIIGVIALIIGVIQLVRRGFGAQVGYMQIIIEFMGFFVCGILATTTAA